MFARLLRLMPRGRRPLARALLVLILLALTAGAGYLVYWNVWAERHYRAAEEALRRRDFARARAHLALCLEVRGNSAEVHFLAARAARRGGAYGEARKHLAACRRLGWSPEALSLESALLEAQGDKPAGVEGYLLACVHKDHPDSVLILEALTHGYLKTFNLLRAEECLRLWLQRQPDDVQALLWQGQVLERLERGEEALAAYRRAVELDPNRDEARVGLAKLLTHVRRTREAVGHYEVLYERQPGNPEVLFGLAVCRHGLGEAEEAKRLLELLLGAEPGHAGALTERGKLALEAGRPAEAEGWLRRAVAAAPYERETVYTFCQCLEAQPGKRKEAEKWLGRLKQIDADMKRVADATSRVARSPRDPGPRCEAGVLLLKNGQEKEGLRWLDSALRLDPRHPDTHRALADYFQRQGRPDLAARHRRLAGPGPGGSAAE